MVATVRCEDIADEKLRCFMLDEVTFALMLQFLIFSLASTMGINYFALQGWLELEAAVTSGPVRSFGMKLSDIIDFYLLE